MILHWYPNVPLERWNSHISQRRVVSVYREPQERAFVMLFLDESHFEFVQGTRSKSVRASTLHIFLEALMYLGQNCTVRK